MNMPTSTTLRQGSAAAKRESAPAAPAVGTSCRAVIAPDAAVSARPRAGAVDERAAARVAGADAECCRAVPGDVHRDSGRQPCFECGDPCPFRAEAEPATGRAGLVGDEEEHRAGRLEQ